MPPLARALERLYARVPSGIKLGLDPMREACARAGDPQRAVPYVHIAGTNGKGSVAALLESTARAAGKRTALYTSPHLCRFAERIAIGGTALTDAKLADALERALAYGPALSFFEVATLAAFIAFAEAQCDYGVLEVGLGGRLDATNVLEEPMACAITSIALDHTEYLGATLALIGAEKAGILKSNAAYVCGVMPPEAKAAIARVAEQVGAREVLRRADDDAEAASWAGQMPWLASTSNAAVAATLARITGTEGALGAGFASAQWPGRMELIAAPDGAYLLDGAHNREGAERLARELATPNTAALHVLCTQPMALVFGAFADKDWSAMLGALAPLFLGLHYVRPEGRAAADPSALNAAHAGAQEASLLAALQHARARVGADGLVVVAGSLHLVGACRAQLLNLPRDPAVAM